jgi:hypothetical protein
MTKLRFTRRENDYEIKAPLKTTGKLATLGYCHPATVPLIKRDGIRPHLHLIKLP